jgi:hypothetical protein
MRKGLLIYEEMHKYFSSYMRSSIVILGKFYFLFYQCKRLITVVVTMATAGTIFSAMSHCGRPPQQSLPRPADYQGRKANKQTCTVSLMPMITVKLEDQK